MKSEKKGICCGIYIVLVNGKLAKNATIDPVLFLVLQLKNHHVFRCAGVDMSMPTKKTTLAQAQKYIFRPENGF